MAPNLGSIVAGQGDGWRAWDTFLKNRKGCFFGLALVGGLRSAPENALAGRAGLIVSSFSLALVEVLWSVLCGKVDVGLPE